MIPLKIHFLNVGHGDSTLIEFPSGRLTMVDINNVKSFDPKTDEEIRQESLSRGLIPLGQPSVRKTYEDKLVDPVQFLKTHYPGRDIFRFIATHPDMDHLSGLFGLYSAKINIQNFWDTAHNKQCKEADFNDGPYKGRWPDWVAYEYYRHKNTTAPKTLELYRGAAGEFFGPEHDSIEVWSPSAEIVQYANTAKDYNHASYVLSIKYGECRIVLGGDASDNITWPIILQHFGGKLPKVNLLKASHHGRASGYHHESVTAMKPDHVVVSVGKLPATDASNRYRQNGSSVYTTRTHGTITASCYPDGDIFLYDCNNEQIG